MKVSTLVIFSRKRIDLNARVSIVYTFKFKNSLFQFDGKPCLSKRR